MNPVLEQAKWGVGGIGPRKVIGLKGIRPAGSNVGPVAHGHLDAVVSGGGVKLRPAVFRHKLSTAAVVGQKKNERVVESVIFFQGVDLVMAVDHLHTSQKFDSEVKFSLASQLENDIIADFHQIPGFSR